MAKGSPAPQGHRARRPRPVHLGRHREGVLPADAADHPEGARTTWRRRDRREPFGRPVARPLDAAAKAALPGRARARCCAGSSRRASARSMHFTDAPEVLEFVNAARAEELAAIGTSCPDHFLRTKIWPLLRARSTPRRRRPTTWRAASTACSRATARATRRTTSAASEPTSPAMRDPYPVIVLVPGRGPARPSRRTRPRRGSPASSTSTRST